MAIHRGIQSAIFYYLSCAPCSEARYRKKRKKEAERGRADREALYVEMPNVYRHPSPSGTNPHWATEIAAGPTLAHRGRKKNGNSGKDGDSVSRKGLKSSMTQRSNDSAAPSSVELGLGSGMDGRNDSKMQFQRYQREDEDSWGSKTSLPMERLYSQGSSGITRPPSAHVRDPESYRMARNPAVNDLHPAVVTRVASKEEAKWMMQPPPTADVMSGKERASRSRSDSGGSSRLSARSGVPLSREVSQRIMAQKLKNGETLPSPTLSRASTALSETTSKGQRHDRLTTDEIDFAHLMESPRKAKRKPSPIRIEVSEDSSNSAVTVLRDPSQAPDRPHPKRLASRPQLSTIKSDSIVASSGKTTTSTRPPQHQKKTAYPCLSSARATATTPPTPPPIAIAYPAAHLSSSAQTTRSKRFIPSHPAPRSSPNTSSPRKTYLRIYVSNKHSCLQGKSGCPPPIRARRRRWRGVRRCCMIRGRVRILRCRSGCMRIRSGRL